MIKIFIFFSTILLTGAYDPNWESLDARNLPLWYDEAKIGIFIHWGVYAVPSFGSEWFWHSWNGGNEDYLKFMKKNYKPDFSYQDFAKDFTAEFFNATEWALLFQKSGAKYVILTSKHHEGYALWPSKYSYSWNSVDIGPHRDIIGELSTAVRQSDLKFGLYHSLYEWFNPMYLSDGAQNTSYFVDNKVYPEMIELVNTYKPEVIWSDGEWERTDTYWKSKEFLAWLYNDSPVSETVVTNDRWGTDTLCKHGGFFTCIDRYNPGVLQEHKWENAMTLDKQSWGYRRNAKLEDFLTIEELLATIASTISCNGNILINVGPTKEGTIIPIFQERLTQLGTWLGINGEAIYGTKPWIAQNDSLRGDVWYTNKENYIYAIVLNWPQEELLNLGSLLEAADSISSVSILGNEKELNWTLKNDSIEIQFPQRSTVKDWAWVLKIETLQNILLNK